MLAVTRASRPKIQTEEKIHSQPLGSEFGGVNHKKTCHREILGIPALEGL